ncbi:putative sulfate exporter family transporter [uncultured Rikenella sp.]|uniref:YeiH family protein n=1 Tax=uncultured Rikenella sp. TaxID=368003 RepID=UPI00261238FE|nr:putative sulfate exporter family transporter [uncultured Rikenella sp.]
MTRQRLLNHFKTEDWLAVAAGLLIMLLAIAMPDWMPVLPKTLDTISSWQNIIILLAGLFVIVYSACKTLGRPTRGILPSLLVIFAVALGAQYVATSPVIKETTGLESVFFAVAFGLLISNTIGVPKWMRPALQSEFYVKIGLVLLGTTVIFGEIMQAGALGLIQALVVVFCVWNFGYWIARKLGVDREMSTMLASAVSICGVSAAIATCGAIKGDSKKLSYVISLVLVVAIPMMYFMPYLAQWMGLSPEVGGAWMGGTIDTTGAVVASGSVLGETAAKYSVIVKFSQNVLLGLAAFAISIYWSYKGKDHREKPTVGVLWERFPKFVLGFVLASLIFSFAMPLETAKSVGGVTKNLQNAFFAIAFVCIGLETRFKDIFNKNFKKPLWGFLIAQAFNIVLTLIVAYLLFAHVSD